MASTVATPDRTRSPRPAARSSSAASRRRTPESDRRGEGRGDGKRRKDRAGQPRGRSEDGDCEDETDEDCDEHIRLAHGLTYHPDARVGRSPAVGTPPRIRAQAGRTMKQSEDDGGSRGMRRADPSALVSHSRCGKPSGTLRPGRVRAPPRERSLRFRKPRMGIIFAETAPRRRPSSHAFCARPRARRSTDPHAFNDAGIDSHPSIAKPDGTLRTGRAVSLRPDRSEMIPVAATGNQSARRVRISPLEVAVHCVTIRSGAQERQGGESGAGRGAVNVASKAWTSSREKAFTLRSTRDRSGPISAPLTSPPKRR